MNTIISNSVNLTIIVFLGANLCLETVLGGARLWWACSHHILEVVVDAAVKVKLGLSSGPTDKIFGRFRNWWGNQSDKDIDEIKKNAATRQIDFIYSTLHSI